MSLFLPYHRELGNEDFFINITEQIVDNNNMKFSIIILQEMRFFLTLREYIYTLELDSEIFRCISTEFILS